VLQALIGAAGAEGQFFDRELWKSLASMLEVPTNTSRVPLAVLSSDGLVRYRQWACEIAERFSGTEVLPVLSTLSPDIGGHVRKATLHASRTVQAGCDGVAITS
jgi:hypothetical protein